MNKKIKLLMVVVFSVLLVSGSFSLYSGEKDIIKCSGCGQKIENGKGVKVDHHGKTLHFCNEKCKENAKKKSKKCNCGTTYVCPMKSCNYSSDKDGKCPKCGMALKKVEKKSEYKCTTKGCTYKSDKSGKCPKCKTELKKSGCSHHKDHNKKESEKK